ncbi:hypothetical protein ERJ75_000656500 [Trypanosoma vivax]|nr:hypothetical protein ERJ75_000656500 [Trypanosoma vivax]
MEWVRACVLSTGPQDNVGLAVFMERVRQVRTCRLRLATRCGQLSAVREVCSATSFCAVSTRGQDTGAEVDSRYVDSAETVKRQRYQDCTQSLHGTGRRAARTLVLSEPREDANAIGVRDKQVARTGAREPNSTPGSEPKAEKADRFGLLHCLRRVDRHWVQLLSVRPVPVPEAIWTFGDGASLPVRGKRDGAEAGEAELCLATWLLEMSRGEFLRVVVPAVL